MTTKFSFARLTQKTRRFALAWGLVAATSPMLGGATMATAQPPSDGLTAESIIPPAPSPEFGPAISNDGFDFVSERPVRRYVSPDAGMAPSGPANSWLDDDEGAAGFGLGARIGHKAGETVGREESITHTELMPYIISGDSMVFGSLRIFRANNANLGGSGGAGYRYFAEDWNRIIGASAWYDVDDHRGVKFEQMSLGLELLGDAWDVRANWYIPVGDQTQALDPVFVAGSARFAGNRLLFTQRTDVLAAAGGVDVMLTTPIPGEWAAEHDAEISAGFYQFDSRDIATEAIWGWRLRADGGFFQDTIHSYLEVADDPQTNTSVVFGVSLDWHGGIDTVRRRGLSQKNRLTEFVRRNDHVVTLDQPLILSDVEAINPDTGVAYTIGHVDNARDEATAFDPTDLLLPFGGAPAGPPNAGTFEDPFQLPSEVFALAPAAQPDIIFVAGGTQNVFDNTETGGPIVLQAGQRLLGEGANVDHLIPVAQLTDPVLLPSPSVDAAALAGAPPLPRPSFIGLEGVAVTLANGSEFSGFVVDGIDPARDVNADTIPDSATTTGILANAVDSSIIEDVTLLNITNDANADGIPDPGANGDGLRFVDTLGDFVLRNVQVGQAVNDAIAGPGIDGILGNADDAQGAIGAGMRVLRGSANIRFEGLSSSEATTGSLIANSNGQAVVVEETTGGNVSLASATVIDQIGDGVLISDTAGSVVLGNFLSTGSSLTGTNSPLSILSTSGTTTLTGEINIVNPTRDAITINDLRPTGRVNSLNDSITISHSADIVALNLNRIDGIASIAPTSFGIVGTAPEATAVTHIQPAINFQNSTGTATVGNLSVATRGGAVIFVGDDDLAVEGLFDPTAPISPADDADPDESNSASSQLNIVGLNTFTDVAKTTAITTAAIDVANNAGGVNATGSIAVNDAGFFNANLNTNNVISLQNNTGTSRNLFTDVSITNITNGDTAVDIRNNAGTTSFSSLAIQDGATTESVVSVVSNNREAGADFGTSSVRFDNLVVEDVTVGNIPVEINPIGGGLVDTAAVLLLNNDQVSIGDGSLTGIGTALTAINNLNTDLPSPEGTDFIAISNIDFAAVGPGVFLQNNRGNVRLGPANINLIGGVEITSVIDPAIQIIDQDGLVDIAQTDITQAGGIGAILVSNSQPDEPFDPTGAVVANGVTNSTIVLDPDIITDEFRELETDFILRDNSEIELLGAATSGVQLRNIEDILITDVSIESTGSAFTSPALPEGALIDIELTQITDEEADRTYSVNITDSIFAVTGTDTLLEDLNAIRFESVATDDEETTLNMNIINNIFNMTAADAAIEVSYDGEFNSTIASNIFNINGPISPTSAAIELIVGESTNTSTVLIGGLEFDDGNVFNVNGVISDTAIMSARFDGAASVRIQNNRGSVIGTDFELFDFDFNEPGNAIFIGDNDFIASGDGTTSFLFSGVTAPLDVVFENNIITLQDFTGAFGLGGVLVLNDIERILDFNTTVPITLSGDGNVVPESDAQTIFLDPFGQNLFFGPGVEINNTRFR